MSISIAQTLPATTLPANAPAAAAGIAVILLMLLGLPASIYFLYRYRLLRGIARREPPEDGAANGMLGIALLVGIVSQFLATAVAMHFQGIDRSDPHFMRHVLMLQPLILGASVAAVALFLRWFHPQRASALRLNLRSPLGDAGAALAGYGLVLPWVLLASTVVGIVVQLRHLSPDTTHAVFQLWKDEEPGLTPTKIVLFATAVIFAPLAEEILFRGLLQRFFLGLVRYPIFAVLAASLAFAAVHRPWPLQPPVFVLSLALGWVYIRTGSLLVPIFLHMLFNLLQFVVFFNLFTQ